MADREEGQKAFRFNALKWLQAVPAGIEGQRDLAVLATRLNRIADKKNPGRRAGRAGAPIGTEQHTEPHAPYRMAEGLS